MKKDILIPEETEDRTKANYFALFLVILGMEPEEALSAMGI